MTVTDHSKPIPKKRQVKNTSETATKWQIYTAADPTVERIFPSLAKEIGLNESIVLMQIAFWIKTSNNIVNGAYWTYQSMTEMQEKAFPYWSVDTIRRLVHKLQKAGYILIDQHNKRKGDNTQWYALEPDKLSSLKSIIVKEIEQETSTPPLQDASMAYSQVATPPLQDRTTLPETPTDTKDFAPISADKPVPATAINPMKDAIVTAFQYKWETMAGIEKGLVQKAARELCLAGLKPNEVILLHGYCAKNFTKFKPMALPGNVSEWRKSISGNVSVLDGLRLVS